VKNVAAWKCGSGQHQLGAVVRNGSGIRQLLLYRSAIDLDADEPGELEVLAVVEGYMTDVRCSICGSMRTWVPGEEALRRIVQRRAL
jgi:hypothetical protein